MTYKEKIGSLRNIIINLLLSFLIILLLSFIPLGNWEGILRK